MDPLEEEILLLYREPAIGASYCNTYGEENIKNLVGKYQSLDEGGMNRMREMVVDFSQSMDLTSSFVSVGVLHALGLTREVEAAYRVAGTRQDAQSYIHHFDIGKSLADHFLLKP
ncbi:MAG: hypothetical protein ACE5E9_10235 [Nitrospinaceae bacterium]